MRRFFFFFFTACLFIALVAPAILRASAHSGSVRAADQFIPGATVTATQGDKKVTAFTDESGRYKMSLDPGVWDVQVEMFGFTSVHDKITVGSEPSVKEWTMEMPRIAGAEKAAPIPGGAGARGGRRGPGMNRQFPPGGGQGPPAQTGPAQAQRQDGQPGASGSGPGAGQGGGPGRGFQSAAVRATQDGQQALADAAGSTGLACRAWAKRMKHSS